MAAVIISEVRSGNYAGYSNLSQCHSRTAAYFDVLRLRQFPVVVLHADSPETL